jgi:hypothetical protein
MAIFLIPCSYRCERGHISHLSEHVVREMEAPSRRRPERMRESQADPHSIEFIHGKAVAVICPRLGRCEITDWE